MGRGGRKGRGSRGSRGSRGAKEEDAGGVAAEGLQAGFESGGGGVIGGVE